jgi:hypothetical protein
MSKSKLKNEFDKPEKRKKLHSQCKFFPYIPTDGALPIKAIYLIFILL